MKLVYIVGGAVAVAVWLALGLVIAKGPQPEIIVAAEIIVHGPDTPIGPLDISNTMIATWTVMILLIVGTFLATRSMKLLPSGGQNFVEAVVGFLLAQVEEVAGEKNARRFLVVVATIFLFVISCNWFGLLPFFNAIGKTEDVGHEIFIEISEHAERGEPFAEAEKFAAWKMSKSGGIVFTKPGGESVEFEVEAGEEPGVAIDRYIVFLAEEFAGFKPHEETEGHGAPSAEDVTGALAALDADSEAPHASRHAAADHGEHSVVSAALGETIEGFEYPGEKLALVIPVFRGTNSDLNNTLALGIIAFVCIEFWGFQALGFGYLKKFFNLNGVNSFVGILELLSEFIRIISFTFRLFGNIFAGEVLVLMLTFLMPFLFVDIIYGLELFVGFIQAAVFALLTLVFASMAVEHHGEGHEEHSEGAESHHGAAQAH